MTRPLTIRCHIMNSHSYHDSHPSYSPKKPLFQTLLHRAFDGSLTAKWREGHAKELLQEMKHQTKA
jgi:hypothetical protein